MDLSFEQRQALRQAIDRARRAKLRVHQPRHVQELRDRIRLADPRLLGLLLRRYFRAIRVQKRSEQEL